MLYNRTRSLQQGGLHILDQGGGDVKYVKHKSYQKTCKAYVIHMELLKNQKGFVWIFAKVQLEVSGSLFLSVFYQFLMDPLARPVARITNPNGSSLNPVHK